MGMYEVLKDTGKVLQEAGKMGKPVMLKRGIASTIDEWLGAAEYLMESGCKDVILCERGLRNFDKHTRNILDLAAVPVAQQLSHLPVFVDPSHGVGKRDFVIPLAKAGIAVGAHGIIVEVHDRPAEALSDGPQALLPEDFSEMMIDIKKLAAALDLTIVN